MWKWGPLACPSLLCLLFCREFFTRAERADTPQKRDTQLLIEVLVKNAINDGFLQKQRLIVVQHHFNCLAVSGFRLA